MFDFLSLAIWLPVFWGTFLIWQGQERPADPNLPAIRQRTRILSLAGGLLCFLATLPLLYLFDNFKEGMQFVQRLVWIRQLNIHYAVGIDGISLWFIPLTALTTLFVVIASWESIQHRVAQYFGAFFILSGLMIGVFSALNAVLFYIFFEATLIPMFFIIGIWGGQNRVYATLKFFLYTLLGSLFMLLALLYLYFQSAGSFDIFSWHHLSLPLSAQFWLFLAFLAAFAVKVPMWPVHTWLPDAHVEAPTGGSVVLAAIMLKLGAYGFLRFSLPITSDASLIFAPWIVGLSLIAVIYVALIALVQTDMKKLIAYASIAHMGFVTLGFFLFNLLGLQGAIIQMISHGLVSTALFLSLGVLYDRLHTRDIAAYGGLVSVMPRFSALFVLFSFANAGLPITSGFIGEFMVILAAIQSNFWIGFLAATSLVLGAAYSLWLVKRIIFGSVVHPAVQAMPDLSAREFFLLGSLAVLILAIGIYPAFITQSLQVSTEQLFAHISKF